MLDSPSSSGCLKKKRIGELGKAGKDRQGGETVIFVPHQTALPSGRGSE